eukprot:CAMPEP_0204060988 /NCGR_PEP_ID=MMETSP0360-20130528/141093_1 /ASSEMBLY_ACC=CAM_ASM_000342 /TAXON_ID=268821 /ORGANISM="Scrippsiella Hangoei, Strain SHTV-5" /LENGTH=31 /DNA_ID= /DNA_START= /DNA_END= /DNA_ORIENTATION=
MPWPDVSSCSVVEAEAVVVAPPSDGTPEDQG